VVSSLRFATTGTCSSFSLISCFFAFGICKYPLSFGSPHYTRGNNPGQGRGSII
jgi:hypothetical protein